MPVEPDLRRAGRIIDPDTPFARQHYLGNIEDIAGYGDFRPVRYPFQVFPVLSRHSILQ